MSKFASYYINVGRYDLCSNEKNASLQLITSSGNFSALFDVDDQPDIDGLLPSQVMDLIEEKINSYWISTSRAETNERIKNWRNEQNAFDAVWIEEQICLTEKKLKNLKIEFEDIQHKESAKATGEQA